MSRFRYCPLHDSLLTPNGWCFDCGCNAPRALYVIKMEKEIFCEHYPDAPREHELRAEHGIKHESSMADRAEEIANSQRI